MPHFYYRHRTGNIYDVFIGNGWYEWTCIRVGRNYTSIVCGYHLPAAVLKEITSTIKG